MNASRFRAALFLFVLTACSSSGTTERGHSSGNERDGSAAGGRSGGGSGASGSGGSASSTGGRIAGTGGMGGNPGSGGVSLGGAPGTGGAPSGEISCDPRKIVCKRAPPVCDAMEVPSVDGSCFGPCVPIATCPCSTPEECPDPNQYTCNRSTAHCTPYLR